MTTTINIAVPALTDNAIWFANAAAWSNYWAGVSGDVTFNAITTVSYTSSPYNDALAPAQITVDEEAFVLPTLAQFNSLKAELQTLNASYQALRNELYNAGFISNA